MLKTKIKPISSPKKLASRLALVKIAREAKMQRLTRLSQGV